MVYFIEEMPFFSCKRIYKQLALGHQLRGLFIIFELQDNPPRQHPDPGNLENQTIEMVQEMAFITMVVAGCVLNTVLTWLV